MLQCCQVRKIKIPRLFKKKVSSFSKDNLNFIVNCNKTRPIFIHIIFTISYAMHGESIVIGLAAISTSRGPPIKTTEPMVSIKITNCSIQLG